MFDPTAFENLKVIVEGAVYDFDLHGDILVTDRKDVMDLASLSRMYSISFQLTETFKTMVEATFSLSVDAKNLSGEILEVPQFIPGCEMKLEFSFEMEQPEIGCEEIETLLHSIWGKERMITQKISYEYNKQAISYHNKVEVLFQKSITEDHVDDLIAVISHMIETVRTIQHFLQK
ncbi:hypothetical protein P4U03_13375 [Bacillus mycoides]|jgi:hypothetical protein|uniref:Group-specific protein n=7 Tax=Bacillus cereus group TaxID=86661 RepID=A0A084ISL7_BACMY|nr:MULTISPECIES: hypothetical protein [Bacillus]EJQ72080.1 hypothetical protein IG7_01867 [Bacillus cereus HuA2-4]EJS09036.1 hypothetical protein IKO_01506 [Bacillus cereus VDM034]EJS12666.1 hypothetical protein IKS_03663 [Bacillus cereus VDM062]KXY30740.1 hypothetical protein AT269_01355 [Bacillus cereus]MBK5515505.1 hypothetical protein [Bacillus sp. TH11]RAN88285.1 hypothetical protein B5P41_18355 [Bacillus sp. SRB_28]